ncbi:hypothetical protein ASF27_19555 [Methylobacterium sp. Leaf102]|uniref:hypothetical protein n=1 Tax=Methylobacterium sp. Leaf102 TaxID=1736253 RepID=UPI0006F626E1|nr:hypothetical protein [Methylobacterium sp. Leaf102]KQP29794.1 hypothetical protein ASF27_19555 [Methylobacterium sp. Leaf102]
MIAPRSDGTRRAALVVGGCGVVVFGWALVAYAPVPGIAAAVAAVPAFARAATHRVAVFLALAAIGGGMTWAAFGTTTGYFVLNRSRLDAVVAEIAAMPTLVSFERGRDDPPAEAERTAWWESTRLVNGRRVTPYRPQGARDTDSLREIDVLRDLGVPYARYRALCGALERLGLAGFTRGPGGEIALDEPIPGGTPWGTSFVYRPDDAFPAGSGAESDRRLAPNWFFVTRG